MAEIAYLAQMLHWPLPMLLDLEHPDRQRFIELVAPESPSEDDTRYGTW